jgi:hypothetical protein
MAKPRTGDEWPENGSLKIEIKATVTVKIRVLVIAAASWTGALVAIASQLLTGRLF